MKTFTNIINEWKASSVNVDDIYEADISNVKLNIENVYHRLRKDVVQDTIEKELKKWKQSIINDIKTFTVNISIYSPNDDSPTIVGIRFNFNDKKFEPFFTYKFDTKKDELTLFNSNVNPEEETIKEKDVFTHGVKKLMQCTYEKIKNEPHLIK